MRFKTLCASGAEGPDEAGARPLNPPIVMSSTFAFEDMAAVDEYYERGRGYVYSRYANPTVRAVERRLARLEGGGDAALFASGMAAISTALLALLKTGDTLAAQRELYGGTVDLLARVLPDLGIRTRWLDPGQLAEPDPRMLEGCGLLYVETPINPTLRLVDLARVAEAAAAAGVPVVVDSTFGTPALQRPLSLGCSLVLHSCTKYLGGHSDLLGGAVVGPAGFVERIALRRRALGGTLDPVSAFLLHRGLRTLAVRMEAHERGAAAVATALREHPQVRRVYWPGLPDSPDHALARRQMDGFGGMVTFEVGGADAARRVHDRVRLFARAGSLGGTESLISLPASMSHRYLDAAAREAAGVGPQMVRLSVGLEDPADLVADLEQALG